MLIAGKPVLKCCVSLQTHSTNCCLHSGYLNVSHSSFSNHILSSKPWVRAQMGVVLYPQYNSINSSQDLLMQPNFKIVYYKPAISVKHLNTFKVIYFIWKKGVIHDCLSSVTQSLTGMILWLRHSNAAILKIAKAVVSGKKFCVFLVCILYVCAYFVCECFVSQD